jgi:ubiquinone/menaquinone biosynthesis C-methylase UbiE
MSVAPFVPSPAEVIRKMLDMVQPIQGEILYDLGCGDGRIVVMAARDYLAKAVGVEIREDLAATAREEIKKSNLEGKAEIIQANFFDVDLSKANVVTLYLTTSGNERLKPKFEKELRVGSRVVSHDFRIPGWDPLQTSDELSGHTIYLYKVNSPVQ